MKLNGTHQLLAYADDVNVLGGSICAVKENAEALVVAAKEIGLEANADKIKYLVISRDQLWRDILSVKIVITYLYSFTVHVAIIHYLKPNSCTVL